MTNYEEILSRRVERSYIVIIKIEKYKVSFTVNVPRVLKFII